MSEANELPKWWTKMLKQRTLEDALAHAEEVRKELQLTSADADIVILADEVKRLREIKK